jgi:hypothetical protein
MNCTLCSQTVGDSNKATFDCGHHFHLSCVLQQPYSSLCSSCDNSTTKLPDIGLDRNVAISAAIASRIQQRQLKPNNASTLMQRLAQAITPLTPKATLFFDHVSHNKRLSCIATLGFEAQDAVRERVKWSDIASRYKTVDILQFGFKWHHMVNMGITPEELQQFSWSQQSRSLELNATKMLQMNMTIDELARLHYTAHQLLDLGFEWQTLASMGANVSTWPQFGLTLEDIKRYWSPTLTQLVSAGFYDKTRVQQAGWHMDDVLQALPSMDDRRSGRVLRLNF